jgi:hypothetical protein
MASSTPEETRDPEICEEGRCDPREKAKWFCIDCNATFCESCWSQYLSHRGNRVGRDGLPHEQTDFKVTQSFKKILFPPKSDQDIQSLHQEDERSTWFGEFSHRSTTFFDTHRRGRGGQLRRPGLRSQNPQHIRRPHGSRSATPARNKISIPSFLHWSNW